jgi:large subunit ribosomal protein L14
MKPIKANVTKAFLIGSTMPTCDNSGAKIVRIVGIKRQKTVKKRQPSAGVADLVLVSVRSGTKEMRRKVFPGVVVRQKKEYRRPSGMRVKFEDNAIVVLKDEKGNPKGTIFKGPIAKEACERWPAVAKLAKIVV